MAPKTNPSDTAEDATVRIEHAPAPVLAAAFREDMKTALDACERCMRWSRQVQAAQADLLDGVASATAGAASSFDGRADVGDMPAAVDKLWRTTFDEMRRRHGDLPYSFVALNQDIARAWLGRLQDRLDRTGSVAAPAAAVDPAQLYDQARSSLDQWMKQWSVLWQPRAMQPA